MRKILAGLAALSIAFTSFAVPVGAKTVLHKNNLPSVFTAEQTRTFLKKAREAESVVFGKAQNYTPLTKQQINAVLSPYFTQTAINNFISKFFKPKGNAYIPTSPFRRSWNN
jgi:hypothetical protein